MRTVLILAISLVASVSAQNAPDKPKADIIFTHGNIYTGDGRDGRVLKFSFAGLGH